MKALRAVLLLSALALHAAVGAAQQAPGVRTLASFGGDSIWEVSVAPNGRFILLGTRTSLWMYEAATRQSWKLADGGTWTMSWSPRGDAIAYVRSGDGGLGEYVWAMAVDPNTGRPSGPAQRVTTGQGAYPSISPDGRFIAFNGYDSGQTRHLAIVPAAGGPERVLARFTWLEAIYWSADGGAIYLNGSTSEIGGGSILKIRVDGGTPEVLRSRHEYLAGMTADRRHLVLVPWKARVAAGDQATVLDTTGREVGHVPLPPGGLIDTYGVLGDSVLVWGTGTEHRLLEMRPIADGAARRLPLVGESNDLPLWSPDGSRLAFQVREGGRTSLAVMSAAGTDPQVYRETDVLADAWGVSWSPDSRSLAFLRPDRHALSLLDVAAGTSRTVLEDTANLIGAWRWRADGQAIDFVSIRRQSTNSIHEVTLSGRRRKLWDLPGAPVTGLQFVGGSDVFLRSDSAALLRSLGSGRIRRFARVPSGTRLVNAVVSNDLRWIGGVLVIGQTPPVNQQIELFSTETGARTVLDLPFAVFPLGYRPEFLPGDSALLVFGGRSGGTGLKLYRVPLNGDPPRAVADVGTRRWGFVSAASASPDGRWVVYSVQPATSTESLVLIDLRGAVPRTPSGPPRR